MVISSIIPITEVHLLKDVPLDNSYSDSRNWTSAYEQQLYFASKKKTGFSYTNLTPVDLNDAMFLKCNAYDVYDCNYVMFKNANFNSRWIYAFIKNIEFVSINCCKVEFEMDVLQTWYFDHVINDSFITREMVDDDSIGNNLINEGLETGEYISNDDEHLDYSDQSVCILSSLDLNMETANGVIRNGVYSGLSATSNNHINETPQDASVINDYLGFYIDAGKEDSIVSVYQYPSFCDGATEKFPASETKTIQPALNNIDAYVPKNNKLFTFPFNFLAMSNNEGKDITFRYENFNVPSIIEFDIKGVFLTTPIIFAYPKNHRGINADVDSGISISNFPQCAWVGDAFKAWFAQSKGALALSAFAGVSQIVGGLATKNPMSVGSGAMAIAGQLGSIYDHTQVPSTAHGQTNHDSLNSAMRRFKFSFYKMSIKANQAKIIDDYFTRYGYKVNVLKKPNIDTRPFWNYVQTIDANITGSIPFNDIVKIKGIYEKGITFWHTNDIGNYNNDNRAV